MAAVLPAVIGALGAVTSKLGARLPQIPGTTSEIPVQKSAVPGAARLPAWNPRASSAPVKDPQEGQAGRLYVYFRFAALNTSSVGVLCVFLYWQRILFWALWVLGCGQFEYGRFHWILQMVVRTGI